jgi:hypothetical protein
MRYCKTNTDSLCCPQKYLGRFDSELVNHFGKPDAGEPHVRFDEGDGAISELSLLYIFNDNFNHQTLRQCAFPLADYLCFDGVQDKIVKPQQ